MWQQILTGNQPVETELEDSVDGTVALTAAVRFLSRVRRLLTSWLTFDPSCSATISRSSRASKSGQRGAPAADKGERPCYVSKASHYHQKVLNNVREADKDEGRPGCTVEKWHKANVLEMRYKK